MATRSFSLGKATHIRERWSCASGSVTESVMVSPLTTCEAIGSSIHGWLMSKRCPTPDNRQMSEESL